MYKYILSPSPLSFQHAFDILATQCYNKAVLENSEAVMRKRIVALLLTLITLFSLLTMTGCDKKIIDSITKTDEKVPQQESSQQGSSSAVAPVIIVLERCHEGMINVYKAIYQETGINPIVSMDESRYYKETIYVNGDKITRKVYTDVAVNYCAVGFGKYTIISLEEFQAIQDYQNETGRQVIYPTVKYSDRPARERNKYNANFYYRMENPKANIVKPKLTKGGEFTPNYWKYDADAEQSTFIPEYNSLRIEGENGFVDKSTGIRYLYSYGRRVDSGVEVRVFLFEYYQYLMNTNENFPTVEEFFINQIKHQMDQVF